jgi:hypothetical protein
MLNIGDTVVLEDKCEYAITSKCYYEEKLYYYMIDIHNSENIKFCYEDNGDLVEINDGDKIQEMLPLFVNKYIVNE